MCVTASDRHCYLFDINYHCFCSGLVGSTQWQETQHDLVVECMQEAMHSYGTPNIYLWLVFKSVPEPENKEEVIQKAKEKLISTLNYIQSIQEKNGTKFIVGDEVRLKLS